jgi:hypothetical protein
MTNFVTTNEARTSAEIIPFRRRAETAEAPKVKTVPWCGGWYHEVAIAEEPVKLTVSGPVA